MLALLWLPITIAGYRMARQRRFAEHREWMIRSFALTTSIVVNRLWLVLLLLVLWPQLDTTFGGDQTAMINTAAGASVWLSWWSTCWSPSGGCSAGGQPGIGRRCGWIVGEQATAGGDDEFVDLGRWWIAGEQVPSGCGIGHVDEGEAHPAHLRRAVLAVAARRPGLHADRYGRQAQAGGRWHLKMAAVRPDPVSRAW